MTITCPTCKSDCEIKPESKSALLSLLNGDNQAKYCTKCQASFVYHLQVTPVLCNRID